MSVGAQDADVGREGTGLWGCWEYRPGSVCACLSEGLDTCIRHGHKQDVHTRVQESENV